MPKSKQDIKTSSLSTIRKFSGFETDLQSQSEIRGESEQVGTNHRGSAIFPLIQRMNGDYQDFWYSPNLQSNLLVAAVEAMLAGRIDHQTYPVSKDEIEQAMADSALPALVQRREEKYRIEALELNSKLSRTERKILQLLMCGEGLQGISTALNMSTQDCEELRQGLYCKLNVRSAAGAVRIGLLAGLQRP